MGLTWRWSYALAAALLFAVEVAIALYVRDRFVRPYLGDVLADVHHVGIECEHLLEGK